MDNAEIDPVKYGVLWQKVHDMDRKVDRLEADIRQLLELANRSKGGLWLGMAIVSTVTGIAGFLFGKH